jgi:hypothetical protein
MPRYLGPSDSLIYEGRIIQRGENVTVSGTRLNELMRLGHQFDGREQPSGPAQVDVPPAPVMAVGANGGPISVAEVLASSTEHLQAQAEAVRQQAAEQAAEQQQPAEQAADRPEVRQSGARGNR